MHQNTCSGSKNIKRVFCLRKQRYFDFKKYRNKKNFNNIELFKKDQIDFIHSQTKIDKDKIIPTIS